MTEADIIRLQKRAEEIKYIPIEDATLENKGQVDWQFLYEEAMIIIESQAKIIELYRGFNK